MEALPALREAEEALSESRWTGQTRFHALCSDTLKPAELVIVKAMKNPPAGVKLVMEAVCIMMEKAPERKIDPSTQKPLLDYWPTSVRLLADMDFRKVSVDREGLTTMSHFLLGRISKPTIKTTSNPKWSNRFVNVSRITLRSNRLKWRKCPALAKVSANGSWPWRSTIAWSKSFTRNEWNWKRPKALCPSKWANCRRNNGKCKNSKHVSKRWQTNTRPTCRRRTNSRINEICARRNSPELCNWSKVSEEKRIDGQIKRENSAIDTSSWPGTFFSALV